MEFEDYGGRMAFWQERLGNLTLWDEGPAWESSVHLAAIRRICGRSLVIALPAEDVRTDPPLGGHPPRTSVISPVLSAKLPSGMPSLSRIVA